MTMRHSVILIFLCFSGFVSFLPFSFVHAQTRPCPDWIKSRNNLPLCPTSRQASILSETFPTGAVVVSSRSSFPPLFSTDTVAQQFTTSFVEQVVRSAQDEDTQMPLILLMGVSESTQSQIRDRINSLDISPRAKSQALSALRPISTPSFTWQQDYWEAFARPNGQIEFRQVSNYPNNRIIDDPRIGDIFHSDDDLQGCGFQLGRPLPTASPVKEGYFGGNIEGLPGGFCLLGDDHLSDRDWDNYADAFCGSDPKNRIKVPTNWLQVGHTDEVMKVFKNNNPKPGQCDFSIAISSPRQATRILSQNLQAPFTSLKSKDHNMVWKLCEDVLKARAIEGQQRQNRPSSTRGSGISYLIPRLLMSYSYAQSSTGRPVNLNALPSVLRRQRMCRNNEFKVTHGDVLKLLQGDHPLARYNEKVQEEMDQFQNLLTQKIASRLKCVPDFMPSPDLFSAYVPDLVEKRDENNVMHFSLPKKSGFSILPNSTNAVSVGKSVILSEPGGNEAFIEYMKKEYEKRGIKARFVDTSLYAHRGWGNLHCATHTVHICRPRSASQRPQRAIPR